MSNVEKIGSALDELTNRLRSAAAPAAAVAEYCAELRKNPEWTADEIELIESVALIVLKYAEKDRPGQGEIETVSE